MGCVCSTSRVKRKVHNELGQVAEVDMDVAILALLLEHLDGQEAVGAASPEEAERDVKDVSTLLRDGGKLWLGDVVKLQDVLEGERRRCVKLGLDLKVVTVEDFKRLTDLELDMVDHSKAKSPNPRGRVGSACDEFWELDLEVCADCEITKSGVINLVRDVCCSITSEGTLVCGDMLDVVCEVVHGLVGCRPWVDGLAFDSECLEGERMRG